MIRVEEARRIVAEIDLVSPKVIVASLEQALGYTLAKNLYYPSKGSNECISSFLIFIFSVNPIR